MFNKKCPRCNEKIERGYDFCPHCGGNLNKKYLEEDYGFIGKDDLFEEAELPFGFGGSMIDALMNRAMKELPNIMKTMEKQMKEGTFEKTGNNIGIPPNMKFRLVINGKEITPNFQESEPQKKIQKKITPKISEEETKRISKLPRKEPETKIKRLSGRLIYEFEVPGVKDMENILVNQLENSIEIKAIAKDKVYSKTLNINLPILDYYLTKGNLILELQSK
jgi:HSP20 family molecular chaperone IbpA